MPNGKLLRLWLLATVCVALGISAHAETEAVEPNAPPAYPRPDFTESVAYPVAGVIDGDTVTLWIDGERVRVRMVGVDTPETVHPQRPVEAYGREASRFTANLLLGEAVYLQYPEGQSNTDHYGRTLAFLFRAPDGLFVNLEIVRQGYGHAETRWPHQYLDLFRHYQQTARESQRGLWGIAPEGDDQPASELPATPAPAEPAAATFPPVTPPTSEAQQQPRTDQKQVTVYVTRTGSKYHRAGCRHLSKSQIPMPLDEAKRRYGACSVCKSPP